MLNHPIGKQIHDWQKDSKIPEETLFPTLIRLRINEENGEIEQDIKTDENHTTHGICSRFTQWNKKIQLPNGRWKWKENVQMVQVVRYARKKKHGISYYVKKQVQIYLSAQKHLGNGKMQGLAFP